MVAFVIENAPDRLRGELTRWLIEVRPGVFAGSVSALVREKLWSKVTSSVPALSAVELYSYPGEQGFRMEMTGEPHRRVVDLDGVQLINITGS